MSRQERTEKVSNTNRTEFDRLQERAVEVGLPEIKIEPHWFHEEKSMCTIGGRRICGDTLSTCLDKAACFVWGYREARKAMIDDLTEAVTLEAPDGD